ncbi:MAG TPA: zf-HC2 domain-containing protein [bacterium]|nr:zf-HC2 domain-containing protein [bacterium]HQO34665.1 zf-HC2 domain-containing protein [bacterium]
MDCENAAEIVVRRIYGEATPEEEQTLFEHLSQCPACREMEKDYSGIARILDRDESATIPLGVPPKTGNLWRWYIPAVAAACFLCAVIAVKGFSIRVGSWEMQVGASVASLSPSDIQNTVRAEIENLGLSEASAGIKDLSETVNQQNQVLAYLLGAQEQNRVLTARTFTEIERQILNAWQRESSVPSRVIPADLPDRFRDKDESRMNAIPVRGEDQ